MSATTTATTTYSPRVTRDGDDFLAEVAVWSDSLVPEYIFVGYFARHSDAYEAACEESTDCAARDAADAALAAQPLTPPERTEDEWCALLDADAATAQNRADALEFEPFDDVDIEDCCESCGEPLDIDAAILADGLMLCDQCYDLGDGQAERQSCREALTVQGQAEDARVEAATEYDWLTQGQGHSRLTA